MQTIQPARRFVFAKPVKEEKRRERGLLLTDSAAERPYLAEVINVGDEVEWLHEEDTIVYKPFTATEIRLNDDDYILIDEEDILGKVHEVTAKQATEA